MLSFCNNDDNGISYLYYKVYIYAIIIFCVGSLGEYLEVLNSKRDADLITLSYRKVAN